MSEKVFCTACGAENNKEGKFCVNCGNKLETPVMPAAEDVQQTTVETDAQGNDASAANGTSTVETTTTYSQADNTYTYSQPAVTYYAEPEPAKQGGYKGVAIAALVCGIVSLVCCPAACCGTCVGSFDILLAIAAVVLGIIALVKAFEGKGMAIAGIVCGGIALLGLIITLISSAAMGSALYSIGDVFGDEFMEEFEDIFEDAMQDTGYYYY